MGHFTRKRESNISLYIFLLKLFRIFRETLSAVGRGIKKSFHFLLYFKLIYYLCLFYEGIIVKGFKNNLDGERVLRFYEIYDNILSRS